MLLARSGKNPPHAAGGLAYNSHFLWKVELEHSLTSRQRPQKRITGAYWYLFMFSRHSRLVEPLRAQDGKQSFESIRHTAWRRIFPAPRYQHYQLLKISLSFIFLSLYSYSYSYSISISVERCAHNVRTLSAHCDASGHRISYGLKEKTFLFLFPPPTTPFFYLLLQNKKDILRVRIRG